MKTQVNFDALGGGAKHIECASAFANGGVWANRTATSNDGELTLGTWSDFSVTILKKCTVIKKAYNQTQETPYSASVGDVIAFPLVSSAYSGSIMLIEE